MFISNTLGIREYFYMFKFSNLNILYDLGFLKYIICFYEKTSHAFVLLS